ncbi:hypothetical protein M8C21_001268, partial [Ambrosia artemisiifolia]
ETDLTKWTDEKHSLYLRSMEASFVDQLYNSLDKLSCQKQNTTSQYKVLRRGYWSNISVKRENSHLKDADRPHVSPGDHWIRHYRNGSRKRLSSTSMQYPVPESVLDQEPGRSNNAIVAEVTDQNFVEDASCSRKRVVPHCTSAATNEIPDGYVSPKK